MDDQTTYLRRTPLLEIIKSTFKAKRDIWQWRRAWKQHHELSNEFYADWENFFASNPLEAMSYRQDIARKAGALSTMHLVDEYIQVACEGRNALSELKESGSYKYRDDVIIAEVFTDSGLRIRGIYETDMDGQIRVSNGIANAWSEDASFSLGVKAPFVDDGVPIENLRGKEFHISPTSSYDIFIMDIMDRMEASNMDVTTVPLNSRKDFIGYEAENDILEQHDILEKYKAMFYFSE